MDCIPSGFIILLGRRQLAGVVFLPDIIHPRFSFIISIKD